MLLRHQGRVLVGLGSDHTDREVETYGITVSKQMCDKPVASMLWDYAEVRDHWDRLQLRSWIMENGTETIYQDGGVAAMLHPDVLMAAARESDGFEDGTAMLCGTLPAWAGSGHRDLSGWNCMTLCWTGGSRAAMRFGSCRFAGDGACR